MRTPIRSVATLLLAVGVATCADSSSNATRPTTAASTQKARAKIGFAPVFSKSAAAAFASLADFGLTFDHVRIVIVRPPSDTVKDTVVAFAPGQAAVTLDFDVDVSVVGESFNAAMDYSNAQGVLFHGEGTVQSHAADQAAPAQQIVVQYKGPGANIARVVVAPKTITVVYPGSSTFAVTAFDSSNAPVSAAPVSWTTSDASIATISSAGVLAATGKRGSVTVTATTPTGISDNGAATISLPASSIALISGGGQSGKVGTTLAQPAVVRVSASDGVAVPGVNVNFAAPIGGRVGSTTLSTDANGMVSTSLTLAGTIGSQGFVAALGSISVSIPESAVAGDPASVAVVSGNNQADTVRHVLKNPLVASVADAFGNPLANATVTWTRTGTGSFSAPASLTGADGHASITYTLGASTGVDSISASAAGATTQATFVAQAVAGPSASVVIVSGDNQSARVQQALGAPLVVKVLDAGGNPVRSATVTWSATTGAIPASTTTDTLGVSSNTFTAGSVVGPATVTAASGSHGVSFTVQVQTGVVARSVFLTQPTNGSAGNSLTPPIQVALQDLGGNLTAAANSVTIALGANPGSATLTGTLTRNAVAGVATFDDLKFDRVGTGYTLVVTSTGVPSITSAPFNIGAGAAANMIFLTQPSTSANSGAALIVQPVLQLQDASSNAVAQSGVVVTASVVTGSGAAGGTTTATTDAQGQAHFSNLLINGTVGTYTLGFNATGLLAATSGPITLAPGSAARLVFVQQPASAIAGVANAPTPTVQVRDASGNAIASATNSVTVAITSGTGTAGAILSGVPTVAAAAGVAAFTNLTINRVGTGYTLTATSSGLTATTSAGFAISAAAPASFGIFSGNNQHYPNNGGPTGPAVTLVTDAFNNPVPGVQVAFVAGSNAQVNSGTSINATTSVSGRANVTLSAVADGSASATATVTGLPPVTFNVVRETQGPFNTTCQTTTVTGLYCWGDNSRGQLGNGTTNSSTTPTSVSGGLPFPNFTSSPGGHQCGLIPSGQAYCWGRNSFGEVGDNSTTDRTQPTPVAGGLVFSTLATSYYSTCGVTTGGQTYCWGWAGAGIFTDSLPGQIHEVPTLINTLGRVFTKVAVLNDFACGIEASGALSCWGSTPNGISVAPVIVPSVPLVSLTAGDSHVCGLSASGAAYCFGSSIGGELGIGGAARNSANVPTAVVGGLTFAEVKAFGYNTCARTTTAEMYCWGQNGQYGPSVGDGTGDGPGGSAFAASPSLVAGGISWGSIIRGDLLSACGTSASGQPFCWGANNLGTAATSFSNTPVPVDWVQGNPGAPASIVAQSGNNSSGSAFVPLSTPMIALVRDYAGHPVINSATVTFTILSGGGSISGNQQETVQTDSFGNAVLLGWILGPGTNTVSATLNGIGSVIFTVTGTTVLH